MTTPSSSKPSPRSTARRVVVIDHDVIRRNYAEFRKHLPKVQAYYAVKANPAPGDRPHALPGRRQLRRGLAAGVHAGLREHQAPAGQGSGRTSSGTRSSTPIPIKPKETLQALDQYKPLVTYDNRAELRKIKQYAPHAGLVLRLRVPNTGSMVELSSKFGCDPGEAVDLIAAAFRIGLVVEGLSFHVGSQCTNFENFVQALNMAAAVMQEAESRGHEIKILDIGGGFPAPYDRHVKPFSALAQNDQRRDRPAVSRRTSRSWPSRAASWWPPRPRSVARIIGKAVRDGKTCYYIDDSVYHTFSGIIFDHCQYHLKAFKKGTTEICAVFGQTCDGLDTISQSEELPDLEIDDLVYSENIGAYSNASSTWFNGFPPAKVVHVNE